MTQKDQCARENYMTKEQNLCIQSLQKVITDKQEKPDKTKHLNPATAHDI